MTEEKIKCKACKELIWVDATICPKCQTHQTKQLRKTVLVALKELSAITVIFTLIFAVIELNRFADSWFENSAYVNRLVTSASILIEAGEYPGARKLLADAREISPASEEANILQMQLAMTSIREHLEPEVIIDSLDVLYRNLGRNPESDAAVLTHIARASYFLRDNGYADVDINLYLDKALALDASYVYANVYKGQWYLNQTQESLTDTELTQKAQQHFNVALQQNIDTDYIRDIQLYSLKSNTNQASDAEYLKIIFTLLANNDAYFLNHQKQILYSLSTGFYGAISQFAENNEAYLNNVYLSFSEQNMNRIKKLTESQPDNADKIGIINVLFAVKSELNGDYFSAIENYINAYKLVQETMSVLRYDTPKLLNKVCRDTEKLNQESIAQCDNFFTEIVNPEHFRG